jgi:FAD/FMN-containing dehydrogenase
MKGSAPAASIDALANGFAADVFTNDPEWMESYARDRTGRYYGLPFAVARPRTVDEVAAVVRRCVDLNLGIVPQGGLTGLVGAAVSDAEEPEVVMLLDRMNAVRSVDPAGYVMVVDAGCILEVANLKQLFIGAEGTLGIVTAVALKLFPKPTQVETAWLGLRSIDDVMAFYAKARRSCSDLLSAFELILRDGLVLGLASRTDLADPLGEPCPVYVLVELSAGGTVDLRQVLEACLEDAGELIVDGTIAASKAQAERLWLYREAMVEAQSRTGAYYRTDVSVPLPAIPAFLEAALDALAKSLPEGRPIAYGHVGDGNIHLNVVPPPDWSQDQRYALFQQAETLIFGTVDRFGGSFSAEHGVGRSKKRAFLERVDPVTLDLFRTLKSALDPQNRLSRGRIFDLYAEDA